MAKLHKIAFYQNKYTYFKKIKENERNEMKNTEKWQNSATVNVNNN